MEISNSRVNRHGTRSIAFTESLLKVLEEKANLYTNGNLSEVVRVLTKASLDRMDEGKLVIRKSETTTIEIND